MIKIKKRLFNVTGTHNAADWITDGYLAAGKLKNATRYKEADKMLKIARDRYKPSNVRNTIILYQIQVFLKFR
jgi:hypothetical protein